MKPIAYILKVCDWLTRPALLFYALPWLLVLLTMGTVAQRYIGLYHSERLFFGSFWLWIGPVPLPGAYLTLSLIALGLMAKLILKSPLRKRSIGNVITHVSVLILLVGGLISAMAREEGYITLLPEQSSNAVSDYHDREMVVAKNNKVIAKMPFARLREGDVLEFKFVPFIIHIKQPCYPCTAEPLDVPDEQAYGMASVMTLVNALPNADDGKNLAGAMIRIEGTAKGQNGTYAVMEHLSEPPDIIDGKDHYTITMRPAERPLPFSLQLKSFVQENHPGTAMAREYRSQVQVTDGTLSWKAFISMNEPLRYRGYTIYQSSFVDTAEKQASVLAVVKNAGWLFPYLSVATLCIGLIVHLVVRAGVAKKAVPAMLLLCIFFPSTHLHAQEEAKFDYASFAHIPVLHEGRIKPLDSMARALLKAMSGDANSGDHIAAAWLAEVILDPASAAKRPLFPIKSPEILNALNIPKSMTGRYAFSELAAPLWQYEEKAKLLGRDLKSLSGAEKELEHLLRMTEQYDKLAGSLTLLMPLEAVSPSARKQLHLPGEGPINVYHLLKSRHELMEKLQAITKRKGDKITAYTPEEQELAELAFRIDKTDENQRYNTLLRVIPGQWESSEEWLSPWEVVRRGATSPETGKLFTLWSQLIAAWQTSDGEAWAKTTVALRDSVSTVAHVRPAMLELEIKYNHYRLYSKSMLVYGIALALVLAAIATQRKTLLTLAFITMALAIALHGSAVLTRMLILERPPVSTLYESMLFVSLIASVCGFYLSKRAKGGEGMLAGGTVAIMVLYLADIFAGQGDTLEMLTAVLNTNFWLGTHVVCITAGYGFSLIAGVMAHIYLFRRAMATPRAELAGQYRLLHTLALIALFFTAVGTMLGGIWADQSWGRFWGWDPKENGALAIVLWLIWILHGRIAGQLRETAFAAMLALITIVVALAWVGVNLLSVGLHSYGFSDAAAWGLPIFCLTELVIIAMLAVLSAQQYDALKDSA